MKNKKFLFILPLCFLLLFNGKKYEQAVIERLQMPIKICLEEQECGNAASASQLVATVPATPGAFNKMEDVDPPKIAP